MATQQSNSDRNINRGGGMATQQSNYTERERERERDLPAREHSRQRRRRRQEMGGEVVVGGKN